MGRILIVEDDEGLASMLAHNLHVEGHVGACARDVPKALRLLASFAPELVLLDLMLPGGDGLEICRELARRPSRPAIIILSARGATHDKVRGLDLGADDYLAKSFDLQELLARVRAALRRFEPSPLERLTLGEVVVDFGTWSATRGGEPLALSHREFQILRHLGERAGKPVSRDELLRDVWGYREPPNTRAVDIAIKRLREKVEPDPRQPRFIRTLHGDGYCLIL